MKEYYKIKSEALVSIADAIRSKKETTAVFTPEQMAAEIESIAINNDLPVAEDNYFGTTQSGTERCIMNADSIKIGNTSAYNYWATGYIFSVNEIVAFHGFLTYGCGYDMTFTLWDVANNTILGKVYENDPEGMWNEYKLDAAINLQPGIEYAVTAHRGTVNSGSYCYYKYYINRSDVVWNNKISYINKCAIYGANASISIINGNADIGHIIDPIIAKPITETVVTEYKIQLTTLNDIADELRRIGGVTGSLSMAQMLTLLKSITLQDKSVTPTAEVQTITPDDGYYALSSVTVEAIDSSIATSLPDTEEGEF